MRPPIIWAGNQGLSKQWQGNRLQLADRVTRADVYRGPQVICENSTLLRGTYGTGFRLGWVVTGSTVESERKGIAVLTISWEIGGPYANPAFLPLDDFRCESVELYPKVERNKHMYGDSYPGNPGDRIAARTIALCYDAVHGNPPNNSESRALVNTLSSSKGPPPTGSTWEDQENWGLTLLEWLDHGNETYYQAGIKYSYIWHSFVFPTLSEGGIIQSPNGGPFAGNTVMSWLRLADVPEPAGVNGSAYKITSTWLGGPNGHWDAILYG